MHKEERGRAWIPAIVLIAVALTQIVLARTAALSPWKGGGFGMFATTDGMAFRYVRVFVVRPEHSEEEELDIAPSQTDAAARAQLFPSDTMLNRLALAVVKRERRYNRLVSAIRLEVWRTEFTTGSLEATDRPLRVFTLHVDKSRD